MKMFPHISFMTPVTDNRQLFTYKQERRSFHSAALGNNLQYTEETGSGVMERLLSLCGVRGPRASDERYGLQAEPLTAEQGGLAPGSPEPHSRTTCRLQLLISDSSPSCVRPDNEPGSSVSSGLETPSGAALWFWPI